jgi:hypothetical protein
MEREELAPQALLKDWAGAVELSTEELLPRAALRRLLLQNQVVAEVEWLALMRAPDREKRKFSLQRLAVQEAHSRSVELTRLVLELRLPKAQALECYLTQTNHCLAECKRR